jgi:hypothetical protein
MNQQLIQNQLFDPVVPYINFMTKGMLPGPDRPYAVNILFPELVNFDMESLAKYFADAVITKNEKQQISGIYGIINDPQLGEYIYLKWQAFKKSKKEYETMTAIPEIE